MKPNIFTVITILVVMMITSVFSFITGQFEAEYRVKKEAIDNGAASIIENKLTQQNF